MPSRTRLPIHFVGSVPLPDTEDVFKLLCTRLPQHSLKRIPDGEPQERNNFVMFQRDIFERAGVGHVVSRCWEPDGVHESTEQQVAKTMQTFPRLDTDYDTAAIQSYKTFCRQRDEGTIPEGVRFQVCLPTATNLISQNIQPSFQVAVEPHYEAALVRALENIQSSIPHEDLAVQIDLAVEFAHLEGANYKELNQRVNYISSNQDKADLIRLLVDRIDRMASAVAPDVQIGFHFCYGDFGRRHVIEPKDTGNIAALALAIIERLRRPVDWIHFPVPKDRVDEAYLLPVTEKLLPVLGDSTELYLGLVIEHDLEGSKARLAAAHKALRGRAFGIATECGLGRRTKDELESVLEIERTISTV